jgi:hypothetical protein
MDTNDFTVVIPSCDPKYSDLVYGHICEQLGRVNSHDYTEPLVIKKNGSNYPSFSRLVNHSILLTRTESVIICSDRCKPTREEVYKTMDLIDKGYGFVGLWRFGFFGFKKQLIQRVGFLDENFVGGGYEDSDFMRRLKEADIAYYESEEGEYRGGASRWKTASAAYFYSKWSEDEDSVTRLLPDPVYDYDIGEWPKSSFLKWKDSVVLPADTLKDKKFLYSPELP